jgi:carboxylesterase type B
MKLKFSLIFYEYFRNPTPDDDDSLDIIWPKYDNENQLYLDIGSELKVESQLNNENLKIWRNFQSKFTGHL